MPAVVVWNVIIQKAKNRVIESETNSEIIHEENSLEWISHQTTLQKSGQGTSKEKHQLPFLDCYFCGLDKIKFKYSYTG